MKLHNLTKIKGKSTRKRVGRGNGSGMGTYSSRGCKGQGQRKSGNVRPGFEGGQTPLIRRMPKLRGFKNPLKITYQVINVKHLEAFKENEVVEAAVLLEKRMISKKNVPVKILGYGELKKKIKVGKGIKVSKVARGKIEKAGGKVGV